MRQDPPAHSQTLERRAGDSPLLSRLYREVGLAAVAAEFHLQTSALEPEAAEAVERGAMLLSARTGVLAA